jgi:hypothetical protein
VDNDGKKFESVYSAKVRAGKRRTYFFDVRKTKGEDFYITLTESTKRFNGDGYDRHKIFLYKEDFNRFLSNLEDVVNHVKTELMPDYDYEEYTKRQLEWEAKIAAEAAAAEAAEAEEASADSTESVEPVAEEEETSKETPKEDPTDSDEGAAETEEDISW